jgi:hypothetical protein
MHGLPNCLNHPVRDFVLRGELESSRIPLKTPRLGDADGDCCIALIEAVSVAK